MNPIVRPGTLPLLILTVVATLALAGCSDDDPAAPAAAATEFILTIENVSVAASYPVSGVFDTPAGAAGPAPIFPGEAYEFEFGAVPGARLSFATMFVQSNDLFYAPAGAGIELFAGATPVEGDVTAQVALWDAGTEANEPPGTGANQAPRQTGPDTGPADADATLRLVDDGFAYPAVADVIAVTITHLGDNLFRARIENVSDSMTLMTGMGGTTAVPLAPGAFVVHTSDDPLFSEGMVDMLGLEGLAEDGDPSALAAALAADTGLPVPLAPGVVAIHSDQVQLFTAGAADAGLGLEDLAEDGNPALLAAALDGADGVRSLATFTTPVGAAGPAPIFPGERYEVSFRAQPGDRLSLATMFVQSNDLFYGFNEAGLDLFGAMGGAVAGDVTAEIILWDAGTEANQWPGVGPDQAPRQGGADTGPSDPTATVRPVDDGYLYPAATGVLRVTLRADG